MAKNECPGCDDEDCQSCCDHFFDPDEGFMCLNCGKDGTEEAYAHAEFMAELREDR